MPPAFRRAASGPANGSTLFERMRRGVDAPTAESGNVDIPTFLHRDASSPRGIVFVEEAPEHGVDGVAGVRFVRGDTDGSPAVVMEERGPGNA